MYLIRVNYRNGLQQEYLWHNASVAREAYETLQVAQDKAIKCKIMDDGAREASIDGNDVISIQYVDAGAEVAAVMKLRAIVMGMEQQFAPRRESLTRTMEEAGYVPVSEGKFAA